MNLAILVMHIPNRCPSQVVASRFLFLQIAFGFGASPWLVQQLQEFPQVASGLGPIAAQLGLAVTATFLIQRVLTRNDINSSEFFHYDAQPRDLAVAGAMVGAALVGNILVSKLSGGSASSEQLPRSVAEMQSIVALQHPVAVLGAGAASIIAAPWIEERIYRGAILQGLLPYIGPVASVRLQLPILQLPRLACNISSLEKCFDQKCFTSCVVSYNLHVYKSAFGALYLPV